MARLNCISIFWCILRTDLWYLVRSILFALSRSRPASTDQNVIKQRRITFRDSLIHKWVSDTELSTNLGRVFHCFTLFCPMKLVVVNCGFKINRPLTIASCLWPQNVSKWVFVRNHSDKNELRQVYIRANQTTGHPSVIRHIVQRTVVET